MGILTPQFSWMHIENLFCVYAPVEAGADVGVSQSLSDLFLSLPPQHWDAGPHDHANLLPGHLVLNLDPHVGQPAIYPLSCLPAQTGRF